MKKGKCGKYLYKTTMSARNALNDIRLLIEVLGREERGERSYYYCKVCRGYHLTHY